MSKPEITEEDYQKALERGSVEYPRPYAFVRFKFEKFDAEDHHYFTHFNLDSNQRLIFVAEIPNMLGHGIFWKTTRDKQDREHVETYIGYHITDFEELNDDMD